MARLALISLHDTTGLVDDARRLIGAGFTLLASRESSSLIAAAGLKSLLAMAAANAERVTCAIVHPCDTESLRGAVDAAEHGLFTPVYVAPRDKLLAVVKKVLP